MTSAKATLMENFIFGSMDQLDKLKIPYFLGGSTLMAFLLQRKPFDDDSEIDMFVQAEYREKILKNPLKYYFFDKRAASGFGSIGFYRDGDAYRTDIVFIITRGKYVVLNIWRDCYYVLDKDIIFPYSYIEFEGRKVPVPHKYEEYLKNTYRDNWRERKLNWHWNKNPKVIQASSVEDAIRRYENRKAGIEERAVRMNTLRHIENRFKLKRGKSRYELCRSREVSLLKVFKELEFNQGAQVGVGTGRFSKTLCSISIKLKLFAIDTWESNDGLYNKAKIRLEPFTCQIIRDTSMNTVKKFADNSLDFVFLDEINDYKSIKNNIWEWSKKVRKGGIVAGYNYTSELSGKPNEVKRAVDGWVKKKKIRPLLILNKDSRPTWMYVK